MCHITVRVDCCVKYQVYVALQNKAQPTSSRTCAPSTLIPKQARLLTGALRMCGIFGYYNYRVSKDRREILAYLFTGLRRLEYRGYDSAGISFDRETVPAPSTKTIPRKSKNLTTSHCSPPETVLHTMVATRVSNAVVIKSPGKVETLMKLAYKELASQGIDLEELFDNHAGIAHTRWATHGPPSAINSHPQVSDTEHGFIVVHNGIITNYKALKAFLVCLTALLPLFISYTLLRCHLHTGAQHRYVSGPLQLQAPVHALQIKKGEVFVSQTDTEIIPKLCNYIYSTSQEDIDFHEVHSILMQAELHIECTIYLSVACFARACLLSHSSWARLHATRQTLQSML